MTRTTITQLVTVFLIALTLAWGVLRLLVHQGIHLGVVNWLQIFACLVLAGLVTWGGLSVRAYIAGKKPSLSGLAAARIAVFAKACSLGGVIFMGWYGAQVLLALENISVESQQARALWAGAAAVSALIMTVCAMIAERNCQIPPSEPETEAQSPAGSPA